MKLTVTVITRDEGRNIEAALQSATERYMRTFDEADWNEKEQLRKLRDEHAQRLANLTQDDEGA